MHRTVLLGIAMMFAFAGLSPAGAAEKKLKVLLFTGGEIHDGKGIGDVLEEFLKKDERLEITRVYNDLDCLVAPKLDPFDCIIFQYTVGTITEPQKRGLMEAVAAGKGFVGFHSAADSFRGDPDWRAFVGGHFITHPAYRPFQVSVTEEKSSITAGITEFMITDEQYILDYDPRVRVLATGLFKGKAMPAIWTKPWGKGRVYYMSFGHDPRACRQEIFQTLLLRAILWAAGASGD
ncbi:MAG: ThuA domain-containing protein [Planctomycetes bacterium]|nr:ThuA domain-containing protein [Planctomycetota bacterium]